LLEIKATISLSGDDPCFDEEQQRSSHQMTLIWPLGYGDMRVII